jgi:hypothetical protein
MEGDPEVIKGMVFPYEDKVTVKQIRESLEELAFEKLIIWYLVDDNRYIQFPNFKTYQTLRKDRDYKSDYPDPVDIDMTSHDMSGLVGQNLREGKEKVRRSEGEGEEKSNFDSAIESFAEFRKKIRKPMTDRAVELLKKKLDELASDEETKIEIINQSIMNGWQGVFPLKNNVSKPPGNPSKAEIMEQAFRELKAEENNGTG